MDPTFVAGLREAKALLDEGILTQVRLYCRSQSAAARKAFGIFCILPTRA